MNDQTIDHDADDHASGPDHGEQDEAEGRQVGPHHVADRVDQLDDDRYNEDHGQGMDRAAAIARHRVGERVLADHDEHRPAGTEHDRDHEGDQRRAAAQVASGQSSVLVVLCPHGGPPSLLA